ncbi:MAG: hypothetical protein HY690_02635 [Chloroflexi bacterium]|nr:hypothetical protein [Chloroflexota bacterium]
MYRAQGMLQLPLRSVRDTPAAAVAARLAAIARGLQRRLAVLRRATSVSWEVE